MAFFDQYHELAGALAARVFLGVLFFFQGYDAVFKVGTNNVIATFQNTFGGRGIPKFLISISAWFTSYTGLVCGALLIVGLFEYVALILLALNLLVAAIGFGVDTPMWDTRHVMPRMILILFLLSIPGSWHAWSLDNLIFKP